MKWYYADGAEQSGPVTEPQIENLFHSGRINSSTLVWHDGMGSWLPFGQVKPALIEAAQMKADIVDKRPLLAPDLAASEVVCSQCNQIFPRAQLILIRDFWVCPDCKPAFVQKLKEGTIAGRRLVFAGFGVRLVAKFLDNLIFGGGIGLVVLAAMSIFFPGETTSKEEVAGRLLIVLAVIGGSIVLIVPIKIWCLATKGGTPGKRICKLRVIAASGEDLGWGRATGRIFAEWITQLTFSIGYIIAAFDIEKRTIHDYIAGTRVVKD